MKKLLAVAVAAAIIVAGYFGYQQHTETAFLDTLTPHLKNASIRVTNSSELEIKPSQATFKEVFDRLDVDVTEIEKHLIEVQSISSSKTEKLSSPAIAYLRAAQEFSRALSMKYRKRLAASNSLDRYRDALKDRFAASGYGYEHAKDRSDRASEDVDKAVAESRESTKDLQKATASLKAARAAAASHFPDDALVATKQLDEVIASNAEKPKPDVAAKK